MTQKRYAIVRVDGHCPNRFEAILNENVCKTDKNGECYSRCSKSRYGDTKEQLVLKITQVLRTKRALFGITDKQLAESIVEFLGVEE